MALIRTYAEACALKGMRIEASVTNGRTKKLRFEQRENGRIEARLFDTAVATFTPDGVEIRSGGWVTPTTFDGICAALGLGRIAAGTRARVPYVLGHRMSEGMLIDYDGRLIRAGETETPMTAARS